MVANPSHLGRHTFGLKVVQYLVIRFKRIDAIPERCSIDASLILFANHTYTTAYR
jgi:hypothetical protein